MSQRLQWRVVDRAVYAYWKQIELGDRLPKTFLHARIRLQKVLGVVQRNVEFTEIGLEKGDVTAAWLPM